MITRFSPVLILAGLATVSHAQASSTPDVPDKIKAPSDEKLVLRTRASGSQIYVCQAANGKPEWMLKAPEALLRDQSGAVIVHHYAGPTWKHSDGSEVWGKAVARVDSPDTDSIPWLLVTATGHSGSGVLAGVESIQRVHTQGGQPPQNLDCNPSRLNTETRSGYTADYYFYAAAEAAAAEPPASANLPASTTSTKDGLYVYPKNRQTDQQQKTDRNECHTWAASQSGFDPTAGAVAGDERDNYVRAVAACLDGRGYSVE